MPRQYNVVYNGTITNAGGNADLLEVLPASNKPVRLVGWSLGQTSEIGDSAEEAIRITVQRFPATVTSGSGGSSVTPVAPDGNDTAAGFTAECNNTTVATTNGTAVVLEEHSWNIRSSPWERHIPEDRRPRAVSGEALIVRMESTLSDDIAANLTFHLEEL